MGMRTAPQEVHAQLEAVSRQCSTTVDAANRHSQYLEINVAGFRKLLKRHEKQIPLDFNARPMPFLGFHQLVTHKSNRLLDVVKQLSASVEDAWERFERIANSLGFQCAKPALHALKSLGPE